ncbi:MAG: hypothetical protein RID09_27290 [Coleofasciculus sp. G1-WW12-02]|uniref:hypothetical protein n=1 Tax=Coleofasciculus sp. G1-WW12-02 TaxID=3068483 RepID=UPI003304FDEB
MEQHWIKLSYERNTYLIDLNRISSFVFANNGRLIFWLPDGKVRMIIHPKTNPEAYQQILDYVEKTAGKLISSTVKAQTKT